MGMTIDQATGDLYVIDYEDQTLNRYKPDGEPDPFSALGTNVIDGASGEDATPQGEILSSEGEGSPEVEVAVAPPGAAAGTAGDIYVTDAFNEEIDIFAPTGRYLGQVSHGYSCGVAVAPDGDVYTGDFTGEVVHKLVPSGPTEFTDTADFSTPTPCQVAAGAGPSAGYVFAAEFNGELFKIHSEGPEEGQSAYTVADGNNTAFAVDPGGDLLVARNQEVIDLDVSGAVGPTPAASPIELESKAEGVAAGGGGSAERVYVTRAGEPQIEEYGALPEGNHPLIGPFGTVAQPSLGEPMGMTIDQATGDLYVIDYEDQTLNRYKPDGEPDPFSALGTNVIDGASGEDATPQGEILSSEGEGSPEVEVAVAPPGAAAGTAGDIYVTDAFNEEIDIFAPTGRYLGQVSHGYSCGVAVAPDGDVYIGDFTGEVVHKLVPSGPTEFTDTADFSTPTPCQVAAGAGPSAGYVFAAEFNGELFKIHSEGPEEGQSAYTVADGNNTAFAVDPGGDLLVARNQEVIDLDVSGAVGPTPAASPIELESKAEGVAAGGGGSAERVYVTRAGEPQIEEYGALAFGTIPIVTTEAAGEATPTSVELRGSVNPEGEPLTECLFEYGTSEGYGETAPCEEPDAAEVGAGTQPVAVHARIVGLQAGRYHFRLLAANATGPAQGQDRAVTIPGPPRILQETANPLYTGAQLEAVIDPGNTATTYHFEYGPTSTYAAATAPQTIPAGEEPVRVGVHVGGLAESTTYHFRVVAENAIAPVQGADRSFATTTRPGSAGCSNEQVREESPIDPITEVPYSTGLPDCRGAELVSPADRGPVSIAGEFVNFFHPQFFWQVDPDGSAAAFEMAPSTPGSGAAGEVLFTADRSSTAWLSTEISPHLTVPANFPEPEHTNFPSRSLYLSSDLGCGVLRTQQPLTADVPARTAEEGAQNLYRLNPDGTYTLLTGSVPTNLSHLGTTALTTESFGVIGASTDCSRIIFESAYHYEGASLAGPTTDAEELYEWNEALSPQLRHVGSIPGPSGEQDVPGAVAGNGNKPHNYLNAVSSDAESVIFSATRLTSPNPAEVGRTAVFSRTDGSSTVDVSLSETGTPDLAAFYQDASKDGSRVFFLANYGLTTDSSSGGTTIRPCAEGSAGNPCDLYEYDFEKPANARLTDLSADHNPADSSGAEVRGLVATSDDGSYAYFAAQGQLVEGRGRSFAENVAAGSYNIYLSRSGSLSYVGGVAGGTEMERSLVESSALFNERSAYLARAGADGTHLVFESTLDLTGYESHGVPEAYLFSAGSGSTVCISCRPDGAAPVGSSESLPLKTAFSGGNFVNPPLIVSEHGDRVFFESPDVLAPGAGSGKANIYEWEDGAVFTLVSGEPKQAGSSGAGTEFVGASQSGDDAFIVTPQKLAPQAMDGRRALYDLRVGGGFPAEAESPSPCDALAEGACEGAPAPAAPALDPATPAFSGPGNPAAHHTKKHHQHKKKHQRKKHHKKMKGAKKEKRENSRRGDHK